MNVIRLVIHTASSTKEAHQAGGWEIRYEKFRVFPSRHMHERFGGEISAAHGAFHGSGPAGGGEVSREKNAWPDCDLRRTVGVNPRTRRVGGVDFFDHGGL